MSTRPLKLDALANLIETDGADPKPTMLRVLTDFYVRKELHTPEEDRHFTELALRLIGEVDAATRAGIARRLVAHGNAPALVLRRLADASPSSADTLRFDETSETATPAAPAASAGPAQNPAVGAQDRAAASGFSDRFFEADSAQRRAMLQQLDSGSVPPPGIPAREAAAACRNLESAALRGRPFEFVREMEQALGIPRVIAQKIVNDPAGEPMLAIAKALAMPTDVVQRILLLVNPAVGTSVRRVFDLTELYQTMSTASALRLISLWRYAAEPAAATAHRDSAGARRTPHDATHPQPGQPPGEPRKRDQRAS